MLTKLRLSLAKDFPGVMFAFLPSDMVTQILNLGCPAPIDIQVIGSDLEVTAPGESSDGKNQIMWLVPLTCVFNNRSINPTCISEVERTKAQQLGFSAHDIAQNLLVSLSGSFRLRQRSGSIQKRCQLLIALRHRSIEPTQFRTCQHACTGTNSAVAPRSCQPRLDAARKRDCSRSHYTWPRLIDIFGGVSRP